MLSCNVTQKSLRVLQNYTANWPGSRLGRDGVPRLVNEDGAKPLLIWVFNSAEEFPALADVLGADQPLIGLRSLHAVIPAEKRTATEERAIGQYFANEVLGVIGTSPVFVGGNCQGAPIAGELARALLLEGREVSGFISMEWSDVPALPVRGTLLFGRESKEFNPFLQGINPWPIWHCLFPEMACSFLPGGHGQYFSEHTIPYLAREIRCALDSQPLLAPPPQPAVELRGVPGEVPAQAVNSVGLKSDDAVLGESILLLWHSHFSCLPHYEVSRVHLHTHNQYRFDMTAPSTAGTWRLQAFLAQSGRGQRAWTEETLRFWTVEVI